MKIGLVYTSTTPELIEMVEKEVNKVFGANIEIVSLEDPTILSEVREAGSVTTQSAARLIDMYMQAIIAGCDGILNICSSVGEVADSVNEISNYIGVPIVRIDEEMCLDAVRKGKKIGVMATLPTTLEPTKNSIARMARKCGKSIEIVECLVEGAFGLNQDEFREKMSLYASKIANQVDVIVLAQGSMAYCENHIAKKYNVQVLSSPRYGVKALKKALQERGKDIE